MKSSRRVLAAVLLLFAGFVLIPVSTYLVGGRIVGPYAGSRGLASYLGTIYDAARGGGILALALLFGPLLAVAAWSLRSWLLRRYAR